MRAVWLMLVLAWAGAAGSTRPFTDSRLLLDRRLETLRRILPDGPALAADQALLRELAESARLRSFEVRPRPPLENGAAGDTAFDLTAAGRFEQLEHFFRQLGLSHRPADVEGLTLTGTPDALRLTALVRLPHWPLRAPLPAPPEGTRGRLAGVPRPQADAFARDQALVLAKSEAIAAWRRARRNPRLFLSELAAVVRDRPVVLGYAELRPAQGPSGAAGPPQGDHAFAVRGLTLGDGPARALEARFERGFFRLTDFFMVRLGGCVRFEARGLSPVAGGEAALPLPGDDPFAQDDEPCRVDRDPADGRSLTAKAAAAGGKNVAGGPLTLRLRDVDLADVFFALHVLTGAGFLVDGDVLGRTSVEFTRVTLQEALDALQRAGGLRLAQAGSLWRVAADRKQALAPVAPVGGTPAISFALKRATVRDVLAVMSEADPAYAALGPAGLLGRVSLWLSGAPLPDVRALLLAAAGLGERVEDGRRLLSHGEGEEAFVPVAAAAAERRLELSPHELTVAEFDLAGVGTGGADFVAFAHAPTGRLLAYRAGDPLADGKLRDVQSTDVLLDTDDGPLRLMIAPLR